MKVKFTQLVVTPIQIKFPSGNTQTEPHIAALDTEGVVWVWNATSHAWNFLPSPNPPKPSP